MSGDDADGEGADGVSPATTLLDIMAVSSSPSGAAIGSTWEIFPPAVVVECSIPAGSRFARDHSCAASTNTRHFNRNTTSNASLAPTLLTPAAVDNVVVVVVVVAESEASTAGKCDSIKRRARSAPAAVPERRADLTSAR